MQVTHWHAAAQTIEMPGLRILTDPWFGYGDGAGGGNYDGSWAPSVPLPPLPLLLEQIGPVDYIYLSHMHPDHYSPEFLRHYLQAFPGTRLLVPHEPRFHHLLTRDGFADRVLSDWDLEVLDRPTFKQAVQIIPNGETIDSALVVLGDERSAVVHLNDCLWDQKQVDTIVQLCDGYNVTALLPFCGAGEYPQTYAMDPPVCMREAEKKKLKFKRLYCKYVDKLRAVRAIPIAGESEYMGPQAALNPCRGLATPQEAALWRVQGQYLRYGQCVDLTTGAVAYVADEPREWGPNRYELDDGYRYARELSHLTIDRIRQLLPSLTTKAAHNMVGHRTTTLPFWLCVGTEEKCYVAVDLAGRWGIPGVNKHEWDSVKGLYPREEMRVDPRYLFGLLTGLYQWNTAMGGGHLRCRREPLEDYRPEIYHQIINYFHV